MRRADPTRRDAARIEQQLQHVPAGTLAMVQNPPAGEARPLWTHPVSAKTAGKGQVISYSVFPGADASYTLFSAPEVTFHHPSDASVLEVFYCRSGRVGWNMRGGLAVYLGPGDLSVHSADCCADSAMMFPLGYAEGIALSLHIPSLQANGPALLQQAGLDLAHIQDAVCAQQPAALPACPELEGIFVPLYSASPARRRPYLQLKVQELLLYLMDLPFGKPPAAPCFSEQTELIKEIHRQLTGHLEQRFTIEALSKRYLINTSTLKEVFKAVYGQPIATYMKEYRVQQAMKMLRETDAPISEIAGRVGYETQGKFSKAFKDVAQMLPTEYRRSHRSNPPG